MKCQHLHQIHISDIQSKLLVVFLSETIFQHKYYAANTPTNTVLFAKVLISLNIEWVFMVSSANIYTLSGITG